MYKKVYVNRQIDFGLHMFFKGIAKSKKKDTGAALEDAMVEYVLKYGDEKAIAYVQEFLSNQQDAEKKISVPRETTEGEVK